MALRTCTSSFSVKDSSNTKGVLTAGHCSNNQDFDGYNLKFESELYGGSHDVQWHTSDEMTITNVFRSCEYNRSICFREATGTVPRLSQVVGSTICKYGKTTGRTCGEISTRFYKPGSPDDARSTYVRVRSVGGTDLSQGGDSGGPWYSIGNAYGVHKGGIGNDSFYMAIDEISDLGVSLLTE